MRQNKLLFSSLSFPHWGKNTRVEDRKCETKRKVETGSVCSHPSIFKRAFRMFFSKLYLTVKSEEADRKTLSWVITYTGQKGPFAAALCWNHSANRWLLRCCSFKSYILLVPPWLFTQTQTQTHCQRHTSLPTVQRDRSGGGESKKYNPTGGHRAF